MENATMRWFKKGLKDGIPIALGYFVVAFTLGIAAKNAGLTALQATLASLTTNASAGEYAAFTLMAAGASYAEMALMTLVVSARYLLMSCSLSQKIDPALPLRHRLGIGADLTDEIFGICSAVPGKLNPFYTYGAVAVAAPGWAIGTYFGVLMGNVLPANVVSALSVGLFGMFIAIVVPPARKNKVIAGLVAVSMAASFLSAKYIPYLNTLSAGTRIILLTLVIAGLAAAIFPIQEEEKEHAA